VHKQKLPWGGFLSRKPTCGGCWQPPSEKMTNYPPIKAIYVWDKQSVVGGATYVPRNFFTGSGCTSSEDHKVGLCYSNKVSYTSKNPTHPASTWSHCKPQSRKYPHKLGENEISSSGRKYTFMRAIWSVTAVCQPVHMLWTNIHTHSCMMWGEID